MFLATDDVCLRHEKRKDTLVDERQH